MTATLSCGPELDGRVPGGALPGLWGSERGAWRIVGTTRRRFRRVIVVGTGLAGASAAASLGELGFAVQSLCLDDSPRRAHSVAAQGGINAAKDYQNDGDSVERLFRDTLKGGDFRSREANVYRLAELSGRIIDHCVAQGVPFAREYAGGLANRSFGGALVARTFYARGQTGQQLLLGAYQALAAQVAAGSVTQLPRRDVLDLVVCDGRARGVIARDLTSGSVEVHLADAVVLATGGYANVFHLSTNARPSNATAIWRAYRRGAALANPCFVQFHPTCLPASGAHQAKLTLISESLRNDARAWVPRGRGDLREPRDIPEAERDYYLERLYPRYGNLTPRDIASRAGKLVCDEGRGVGFEGRAVYLDLAEACSRLGRGVLLERYGNVLEMYERITGEDPLETPMRIAPAAHYTMGGLWVDYRLMTTLPGLFAIGEANFSDHGANRLGASALMQALADGYFVLPLAVSDYLAGAELPPSSDAAPEALAAVRDVERRLASFFGGSGAHTVQAFHRELGRTLQRACGLSRTRQGLREGADAIAQLRGRYARELRMVGGSQGHNAELEYAGRVADFLELGELMCLDALAREESCGCHLREEHLRPDGEPLRDDAGFAHVAAWFHDSVSGAARRAIEPLEFTRELEERSYR